MIPHNLMYYVCPMAAVGFVGFDCKGTRSSFWLTYSDRFDAMIRGCSVYWVAIFVLPITDTATQRQP